MKVDRRVWLNADPLSGPESAEPALRMEKHGDADAGAIHICMHPLHHELGQGAVGLDALSALAPGA